MKTVLSTVVLFCSICLVAYAQTVNLRLKDQSVEQAIEQLKKTSGYSFVFASGDLDTKKRVSVNASNATIDNVISQILAGQDVTWQISGQNIVIKKGAPAVASAANGTVRPITYTGTVLDNQGQPVIGAAIFVRGTKAQAMTDADGKFSLTATPGASITVTYLGYLPAEVVLIASKPTLSITLQEDALTIADVVIVGYGTQKRVNLTGAVSTVDKEYLQTRPVTSTIQALQGVVPGLNISATGTGGRLDSPMSINIRGGGTIGDGSESSPLVLIDGVPGDMSLLNPDDVASISVLKDAGSSAIYGSRAAFGVILITTKRGKEGRVNITYSNNLRFSTPIRVPQMTDSYTSALFFNEMRNNAGLADIYQASTIEKILQYQRGEITASNQVSSTNSNEWAGGFETYANVDWINEVLNDWTFSHEHNLGFSGGTEKTQYYISMNYLDRNGILKYGNETSRRYTFTSRIDTKLAKWASIGASFNYVRSDLDEPQYVGDPRLERGYYFQGMSRTFATIPITNPDGSYNSGNYIDRIMNSGRYKTQRDVLTMQFNAKVTPIEGWNIVAEGNYRINNTNNRGTVEPVSQPYVDGTRQTISITGGSDFPAGYSEANERNYKENFLSTNIYTDYSKQWDNGHFFKVMVGFNAELNQDRVFSGYRTNIITLDTPSINTSSGTDKITEGSYNHWSTAGFFGRLNYNYKERYLAEVVLRYDGSSRFKQDLRWNWYPSFQVGWNIAKEGFMEPVSEQINMLKVRASYGTLGNQNTKSLYPYYATIPFVGSNSNWLIGGVKPNTAGMPALISNYLTWERVESIDVGLDFAFLRNRLTGSFSWFQRSTLDMVGPAPQLPNTLGVAVPKTNNADLQTRGWEVELSWNDHIGDFRYGIRATLSDYMSKVTRYPNFTNSIDNTTYIEGAELNNIWGLTTVGIAKTQEEMNAHLAKVDQGSLGSKWAAGDVMYADLNGDGKINEGNRTLSNLGDLSVLGNSTPHYTYGVTLDLAWKGIDLMIFGQGVGQRLVDLTGNGSSPMYWGADALWHSIALVDGMDYFRPADTKNPLGPNLDAKFPRPILAGDGTKNRKSQSGYLEDGSYFRLKTVQLGYTFPREWTVKAAIQKLRFYVSGENLWTITKLPAQFDPETYGGTGLGLGRVYPLQATVSFGVSITF